MLTRSTNSKTRAPAVRLATPAALLAGLAALGAWNPAAENGRPALAAPPATESTLQSAERTADGSRGQAERSPFPLAYVPNDAVSVMAARPASLMKRADFKPFSDPARAEGGLKEYFGVPLHGIDQIVFVGIRSPYSGTIIRLASDSDPRQIATAFRPEPAVREHAGQTYYRSSRSPKRYWFLPNDRTVVMAGNEGQLRLLIESGRIGATRAGWAKVWERIATNDVAYLFHAEAARAELEEALRDRPDHPMLTALAPIWRNSSAAGIGTTFGDRLTLYGIARCDNSDKARELKAGVEKALMLAKAALTGARESLGGIREEEQRALVREAIALGDAALEKMKIERNGLDVTGQASLDGALAAKVAAVFAPAITQAREAARRSMSKGHLKQIALALHNYHDAQGRFPPPVAIGPDGKTPHSWRVELLPYLDQKALYDQYRINEPWDSPHNKKVLAKMPGVFRHPSEPPDSTASGYYVLTGAGTVFSGAEGEEGASIRDITDGTSNTIAVVENKRGVPWTKPEDVPYDVDEQVPKLGGFHSGGFHAALCDGSVRFISESIDKEILRALITRSGGEPVGGF